MRDCYFCFYFVSGCFIYLVVFISLKFVVVYIIPNGLSTAKLGWEWESRWMWSYCAGAFIIFVLFWYIREAVWLCVCFFFFSLLCLLISFLFWNFHTTPRSFKQFIKNMCMFIYIFLFCHHSRNERNQKLMEIGAIFTAFNNAGGVATIVFFFSCEFPSFWFVFFPLFSTSSLARSLSRHTLFYPFHSNKSMNYVTGSAFSTVFPLNDRAIDLFLIDLTHLIRYLIIYCNVVLFAIFHLVSFIIFLISRMTLPRIFIVYIYDFVES